MSNFGKDSVALFRSELISNKMRALQGKLSDEEIVALIEAAILPISLSTPKTKKLIFGYVFFNSDSKIVKGTIDFALNMMEFKASLDVTTKRMLSFFLKKGVDYRAHHARYEFLQTYGKGSTYYSKIHSSVDQANFNETYFYKVRPLVRMIRKRDLKRFPVIYKERKDDK